jgi:hypothetical protein
MIHVMDGTKCILTGLRQKHSGMWHIQLPMPTLADAPQTLNATHANEFLVTAVANKLGTQTADDLVTFAHATLFSPVLSTLNYALQKGFLTNFPGLTCKALAKHPPQSIPMHKGHQDQAHKNQRSTPAKPAIIAPDNNDPAFDDGNINPVGTKPDTHKCFTCLFAPTGQIYSDQTGRFITPSSAGNNYIMVLYNYDSNHIFAAAFQNHTAKCLLATYQSLHTRLCKAGLCPRLQRLNNECSQLMKDFMDKQQVDYQLVPLGVHRQNAAERAIRTFKNHFVAGLCSVDKNFELHLWDKLLPQAKLTLNLLQASQTNPKLSAHAQINGAFDFNRTPLAPPGTCILAHDKPAKHTTRAPHGLDGWYVGPALDSYRCYHI